VVQKSKSHSSHPSKLIEYEANKRDLTTDGSFLNKKYVLWNVYLPNALHSVCLNRLSCTEVGIYNGESSLSF